MKRRTAIVTASATAAAIAALMTWAIVDEASEPTSGTVTEINDRPGYSTLTCTPVGKTSVCTSQWHPPCLEVVYISPDGAEGDVCLDREEWVQYEPGDHYPRGGG